MAKVEARDDFTPSHPSIRGRWDYVRKKLRRKGVVEVSKHHPHSDMLDAVQAGIRKVLTEHPELGPKSHLLPEDYSHKMHFDIRSSSGKSYRFGSYSTPVFSCIRRAVDVSEEDFLQSLAPPHLPYLEFISNSRSGQDFYFSNNQRFILKTDKEKCIKYFISILRYYLDHFLVYPHSLLVKFLGLYSIKPTIGEKKYLLVMQSIFFPTPRIEERFDIKGCIYNRFQNPNPPGQRTLIILKDQNFLQEKLELGAQRDWFLQQMKADVDFLRGLGVQDYSFLLGRHPIKAEEKKESVKNLVFRMRKSFGHIKTDQLNPLADVIEQDEESTVSASQVQSTVVPTPQNSPSINQVNTNNSQIENQNALKVADTADRLVVDNVNHETGQDQHVADGCVANDSVGKKINVPLSNIVQKSSLKPIVLRSLSDADYLDSTGMVFKNRRLLLNCNNNLHIIDGENHRYYIGIIDFFTRFQLRQKVGKVVKDLKTCCGSHSTERPEQYGQRFYEFIEERTT